MKIGKLFLLFVIVVMVSFSTVVASASPDVIWPGSVGNSNDLIVITNPQADKAATFDRAYILSGYGQQGAWVTVYFMENGVYKKSGYSWQIGASGMFFKTIELGRGRNILLCYAEKETGATQMVPLEITYLGKAFTDSLNGIRVDADSVTW